MIPTEKFSKTCTVWIYTKYSDRQALTKANRVDPDLHYLPLWTRLHVVKWTCPNFGTSMTRSLGVRKAGVTRVIKFHKEKMPRAWCFLVTYKRWVLWVKFSADDILKCFTFRRKKDLTFYANCLLRRQFAWNVRSYFLGKKKKSKNIINLSSAEFTHSVLSVEIPYA